MHLIEIINLSKSLSVPRSKIQTFALNDVSLSIEEGEIVGLLGLNGAGKSTLIKVALDLVRPTKGSVRLLNYPNSAIHWRSKTGYLPESFDAPKESTARGVLTYLGRLNGLYGYNLDERVSELLQILDLSEAREKRFKEFSKGMKVRLGFAQAIMNNPSLLIVDEPTDGLDPEGIRLVRKLLTQFRDQGTSVLISSHLLSEIELISDRVIILHKGTIVKEGNTREMLPKNSIYTIETRSKPPFHIRIDFVPYGANWMCKAKSADELQQIILQLNQAQIEIVAVQPVVPSLENLFFQSIT